jgi:hypothetical protein
MKEVKLFISVFMLSAALSTVNAQIENEIKSFVDSTELLVNNGRRMLLQHVQTKDYQKVAEIYDFLNEKTQANKCAPFNYTEDLYIAILINDWDFFLTRVEFYSEITKGILCYPIRDNTLVRMLRLEVKDNASQLFDNALNIDLTSEEIDLLELYFYLIENDVDETYSKKLKDFKKKYPQSIYNDFVNNYLPRPTIGNIKAALGFGLGISQIFPTGNLSNYFEPVTTGGMSMDFYSNKFFLGFQFNAGGIKFKIPLEHSTSGYDENFQKGDRLTYIDGGLHGGYTVLENNRLQLSPYIYLGGVTIESNFYKDDSNNDLEFKVLNSFFIGPGLRTEIKLFGFESRDGFSGMTMQNSLNLRLDIGYNIPTKYDFALAGGNMFYARIALTWRVGNFKY